MDDPITVDAWEEGADSAGDLVRRVQALLDEMCQQQRQKTEAVSARTAAESSHPPTLLTSGLRSIS